MNMSFKHAWDLVNDLNRICGCAVIEPEKGGKDGGGSMLTPFGLSLIDRYRSIEHSVAQAAREELLGLRAYIG
jgi:molybdate transport system regulatory protein